MTPDQRAAILESLRAGVALPVALRAARVRGDAFALARESDPGLADEVATAEREGRPVERAPVLAGSMLLAPAQPKAPTPAPEDATPYGLDADAIAREAAQYALGSYGYFLWLDARCGERGIPAASPYWRWSVGEWYASGKPWGFWLVGRGGGKSTMLELVAAADGFFEPRKVPPNQTWPWPFVSVTGNDSRRRIDGIAGRLRAIGIEVGEKGGARVSLAQPPTIDLRDVRGNKIQFLATAGTIGNASGATTIGGTIDEAAKIGERTASGEIRANPLSELMVSVAQTIRFPGPRVVCCSSAWDREGAHWKAIEEGDNEERFIARLGSFLDDALVGLEAVARWEEEGDATNGRAPNKDAAKRIRAHAATLTPRSPNVPSWVANPAYGNPRQEAWDPASAAIAARKKAQVIPVEALDGLTRDLYFFRENASVPLTKDGADGAWHDGLVDMNRQLAREVADSWKRDAAPTPVDVLMRARGGFTGGFTSGGGTL